MRLKATDIQAKYSEPFDISVAYDILWFGEYLFVL